MDWKGDGRNRSVIFLGWGLRRTARHLTLVQDSRSADRDVNFEPPQYGRDVETLGEVT
jgi:hypothetical protein